MDELCPFMVDEVEGESPRGTVTESERDDQTQHIPAPATRTDLSVKPADLDEVQGIKQSNYILTNRLTLMLDQLTKAQGLNRTLKLQLKQSEGQRTESEESDRRKQSQIKKLRKSLRKSNEALTLKEHELHEVHERLSALSESQSAPSPITADHVSIDLPDINSNIVSLSSPPKNGKIAIESTVSLLSMQRELDRLRNSEIEWKAEIQRLNVELRSMRASTGPFPQTMASPTKQWRFDSNPVYSEQDQVAPLIDDHADRLESYHRQSSTEAQPVGCCSLFRLSFGKRRDGHSRLQSPSMVRDDRVHDLQEHDFKQVKSRDISFLQLFQ